MVGEPPTPDAISTNISEDRIRSTTVTPASSGSTTVSQFTRTTLSLGDRDTVNITTDVVGLTLTADGVVQDAAVVSITDRATPLSSPDTVPPSGTINASKTTITLGETVELRAEDLFSPASEIDTFEWEIGGDPLNTDESTVSVTPTELGETEVGLLIKDTDGRTERVSTTLTVEEGGFEFDTVYSPDSVTAGSVIDVGVTVNNTGNTNVTKDVTLSLPGIDTDTQSVDLDDGESTELSFTINTSAGDAGNYTLIATTPDDRDEVLITVAEQPDEAEFVVDMTVDSKTITEGDPLGIVYTVTNVGGEPATQVVTGMRNQTEVFDMNVTLDSGESTTENTTYVPSNDDVGTIEVGVETEDAVDSTFVTVVPDTGGDDSVGGGAGDEINGGEDTESDLPDISPSDRTPASGAEVTIQANGTIRAGENESVATFESSIEEPVVELVQFDRPDTDGKARTRDYDGTTDEIEEPPGNVISISEILIPPEFKNESARLIFNIENAEHSELSDDDLDIGVLTVWRYTEGDWEVLETNAIGGNYIEAETPGFSYFAITDTDTHPETESKSELESESKSKTIEEQEDVDDSVPGFGLVTALIALLIVMCTKLYYYD